MEDVVCLDSVMDIEFLPFYGFNQRRGYRVNGI